MESSSDDSFAWTNASSDSTDSDAMNDTNATKNQSDVESEYGNSYKKKLQRDLFSNNEENKVDESPQQKKRKRKSKNEQPDEESMESPKKKRIKVEPESDLDTSKNQRAHYKSDNEPQVTSDDERYLNFRVKQENNFATPSPVKPKKKRHKSGCDTSTQSANESESENTSAIHNGSVYQTNGEISDISHSIDSEETPVKVKKKKKKSKRRRSSSESDIKGDDNIIIEDKFTAEETVVGRHQVNRTSHSSVSEDTHKKQTKTELHQMPINNDSKADSSDESIVMNESEEENINNSKSIVNNSHVDGKGKMARSSVASPDISVSDDSHIPEKNNQRVSRISDRIRFEDDHDNDLDVTDNNYRESLKSTKKIKKFLKSNPNLKLVKHQLPSGTVLTPEDDIWVITCPHDIDVTAFKGLNLNLDKKIKAKIDDQTYEGSLNEELGRIPVLSMGHNELVIKNVPQIGTLNLRKRVPKAHVHDHNVMINNQTDFIPLPETKCRHPLFGPNYKQAIKIPKAVAKLLNVDETDEVLTADSERSRKKKHKKDKRKSEDFASDRVVKPKFEMEPEQDLELVKSIKKKSKKRKHEHHDESPPTKKSKRAKHKHGSTEVWESEQAIEENLFNF